ncbi:hypothetical protein FA13DRAFT_649097 [Coprinellus micaceus]|uniref:Uncharacterized protein n=1 Tax=Coprinellus micaceus TaxID=71717 RepID=A0A4Y7T5Y2_COPMI|nr:hypothetical protein FA13DRAFT_649097 [Coprinellus micaceus]
MAYWMNYCDAPLHSLADNHRPSPSPTPSALVHDPDMWQGHLYRTTKYFCHERFQQAIPPRNCLLPDAFALLIQISPLLAVYFCLSQGLIRPYRAPQHLRSQEKQDECTKGSRSSLEIIRLESPSHMTASLAEEVSRFACGFRGLR